MEQTGLLLRTEGGPVVNFSLPVTQVAEVDLEEFLTNLKENTVSECNLGSYAVTRLMRIINFSVAALSVGHKKVTKCAMTLLVKCISIAAHDSDVFNSVHSLVTSLKTTAKSDLHRQLSNEALKEKRNIRDILDEHGDSPLPGIEGRDEEAEKYLSDGEEDTSIASACASTPPTSPDMSMCKRISFPQSAYDHNLKVSFSS